MQAYALRVSVTQHCQLACGYCLPNNQGKSGIVSVAEYERIAQLMARFSLEKIRFTGGEPLVRKDLAKIVEIFKKYHPRAIFALTTNGQLFIKQAQSLRQAGIEAVTFHLDTLQQERYLALMGRGRVTTVLNAIDCALDYGFHIKLNVVVQKNKNDDEINDFLCFSKKSGITVRFIEMMNTGSAVGFVAKHFFSGQDILASIGPEAEVISLERSQAADPQERFLAPHYGVEFGLIASDTRPFCDNCNRLRINAFGKLYTCLYDANGLDLLQGSDDEIYSRARNKILEKESFHPGLKKASRRLFSMAETGG